MALSNAQVAKFAALFDGYTQAYGESLVADKNSDPGEKVKAKHRTVRGLATKERFRQHLEGEGPGLGIIMLRDDNTVVFGAIDYDSRQCNHAKAEERVRELGLPLVVCRSKSGGAHFYCFTTEPVPAVDMRQRLVEWTALLGMAANTEHFPKQSSRFNDDDIGSFINLPYYHASDTTRYAIHHGKPISFLRFLELAYANRVTPERIQASDFTTSSDEADLFFEGPPCLQYLHREGGFAEGGRNNGMTAVVVYLKRRYPDTWKDHVDRYNAHMANLSSEEILHIVKTHAKKDYGFQCKQPPINAHCQRGVCLQRRFGVGETGPESRGYDINSIVRYDPGNGDPPMWGMEVNGKRVMVQNDQLYHRDSFNKACMAQANAVPIHMPSSRWIKYLDSLVGSADIVLIPAEASSTGQLWDWIERFLTQQTHAVSKEEIHLGKVYRQDGKVYFRSNDLFKYLKDRRVHYDNEQRVWHLLREKGMEKVYWNIRGKGANLWVMDEPEMAEGAEVQEPEPGEEQF